MLIKGIDLTPQQRAHVLAAFVHRWTHENARQTYGGKCPACEQSRGTCRGVPLMKVGPTQDLRPYTREEWHAYHKPLISDAEWLAGYAFHFTNDGSRLHGRRRFAEYVGNSQP